MGSFLVPIGKSVNPLEHYASLLLALRVEPSKGTRQAKSRLLC
jgi:hypothetical protein